MKEKNKLVIKLFILFICLLIKNVNAMEIEDKMEFKKNIPDTFVALLTDANPRWYKRLDIFIRNSDGKHVYGIEPGLDIDNSHYTGHLKNVENRTFLNEKEWEAVKQLAYYGYNYKDEDIDHTDSSWYAATQLLIWRITRPKWNIYFIDNLQNKNKLDDKYLTQINEINHLVKKHNIKPDTINDNYHCSKNDEITIVDKNNVIKDFNLIYNENLNAIIENNKIIISCKNFGYHSLKIYKDYNYYSNKSILYISDIGENTLVAGDIDSYSKIININVHAGNTTVEINNDKENKTTNFSLYDDNNNYISYFTTNAEGSGIINIPQYGKYYLIEDDNNIIKYHFEVNENNMNQKIIINNDIKEKENNNNKSNTSDNNFEFINISVPKTSIYIPDKLTINFLLYTLPVIDKDEKKKY